MGVSIVTCHSIREKLFHSTSGSHFKRYDFNPSHKIMQVRLEAVKNHNGSGNIQISRGSRDTETQKMSSEFRAELISWFHM